MTPGDARCPNHPDVPALGSCQRCGTFFCADDRLDVDTVAYCRSCGVRPDVDWLEAYRQSLLGKRDSWAWLLGFSAIGYLVLSANLAANTQGPTRLLAIPALGSAITGALFFFGKPIARILFVISTLFWGAVQFMLLGPWSLATTLISSMFVIAALTNTRHRLFFRLEVPREKVRKDYDLLANNRLARNALALGAFSLVVPVLGPVAVVMGAVAVRAVNPDAKPPVGKRGSAIAAIVFGILGTAIGGWLISVYINNR